MSVSMTFTEASEHATTLSGYDGQAWAAARERLGPGVGMLRYTFDEWRAIVMRPPRRVNGG